MRQEAERRPEELLLLQPDLPRSEDVTLQADVRHAAGPADSLLLLPELPRTENVTLRGNIEADDAEANAIRAGALTKNAEEAAAALSRRSLRYDGPFTDEEKPAAQKLTGEEAGGPAAQKQRRLQLSFGAIAFANVVCQAIFSVLPTFFPPVAKAKGMSDITVGLSFAALPAVVFAVSATADRLLGTFGRRPVFIAGNLITACFTAALGAATLLPDGLPFVVFTLCMQVGQGLGSALAETSSFALLAELFPEHVTFYLGMLEAFTGIGVAIGPPLGGVLYSIGGFWLPFATLACALLPGVAFIWLTLGGSAGASEGEDDEDDEDEDEDDVSILSALRIPQVLLIVISCVLAEGTLTFIMPTFAEHAMSEGLATSPAATGAYFTVNAIAYTAAAPLVGMITTSANARKMIVIGMALLSVASFFLGPSPLVRPLLEASVIPGPWFVLAAFGALGVGEGMSMAPLMEDMRSSCGQRADAFIDALSGVMAASYALGEMLGPIAGTTLTSLVGFNWASTVLATTLVVWTAVLSLFSARRLPWGRRPSKTAAPAPAVPLPVHQAQRQAEQEAIGPALAALEELEGGSTKLPRQEWEDHY